MTIESILWNRFKRFRTKAINKVKSRGGGVHGTKKDHEGPTGAGFSDTIVELFYYTILRNSISTGANALCSNLCMYKSR